jgi:cell division cycle 14
MAEFNPQLNTPICQLVFACPKSDLLIQDLQIFLSQNKELPHSDDFTVFTTDNLIYYSFCDDFGPMSFANIADFIQRLDHEIRQCASSAIVYCAKDGPRELTNAAFLLGAYMVLKLGVPPSDVAQCFSELRADLLEGYRDATFSIPTFRLTLTDCWAGLHQAIQRGWVGLPSPTAPQLWGGFDLEEYAHYDDPLNGNLHVVVPGKLVAFAGPRDLPGQRAYHDDALGTRAFSPAYYRDIFRELGVTAVVRLNEARYDRCVFTDAGIAHHDLYFDDCTAPPPALVARFFRIVDAAPGLVAVHCKAGLGRTGTLAALLLMRREGFSARAAVGWLRIVRPGCVIGEQQHYLCGVESQLLQRSQRRLSLGPAAPPPPAPPADSASARSLGSSPSASPAASRPPPPPAHKALSPGRSAGGRGVEPTSAPLRPGQSSPSELSAHVDEGAARRGAARSAGAPQSPPRIEDSEQPASRGGVAPLTWSEGLLEPAVRERILA